MTLQNTLHTTLFLAAAASFFFVTPTGVQAADPKPTIRDAAGYTAQYVTQSDSDPIVMEAGASKWVTVTFENAGTQTWDNTGSRYISAYTMEPRDRDSLFFGPGWESPTQIGRMAGVIAPGEKGELGIYLHAPEEVGEYTEEFYLAAENYSWVNKGYFYLKITVVPKTTVPVIEAEADEQPEGNKDEREEVAGEDTAETGQQFEGKRALLSKRSIADAGGETVRLIIGYQNLGEAVWEDGFTMTATADFADTSWESGTVIHTHDEAVDQFDIVRKTVHVRTPADKGEYTLRIRAAVGDVVIDETEIPVTVTADAPRSYRAPSFDDGDDEEVTDAPVLAAEPRIKVGLTSVDEGAATQFVSYEDDYVVQNGETGVTLGVLPKRKIAVLRYEDGIYTLDGGGLDIASDAHLRLAPKHDQHAVFTLYNYDRHVSWKGPNNFNTYRGAMLFQLGELSHDVWVINDVLFHDYAKGIGENANTSPIEYLKAQSVAQVSYAYAIQRSDKHGIFDVVATTGDQLYLGYENERIMPNFVQAVNAVRGQMVTYNNDVVITPYYAHSDGRTRGWHEVWGGAVRPWLVSVSAVYDRGSRMLGHGVGMSQIDASLRAKHDEWDYKQILSYYYTDTEVTLMYE